MKTLLFSGFFLLTACAVWSPINGEYQNSRNEYKVSVPAGWMRLNQHRHLVMSKNGPLLDLIQFRVLNIKKPLPYTKKMLYKDMMAQELSEILIDDYTSSPENLDLQVISNKPSDISSMKGIRVEFTSKTKEGLKKKTVFYGLLSGEFLYCVEYSAAHTHYFDEEIGTFEGMIKSLRILRKL